MFSNESMALYRAQVQLIVLRIIELKSSTANDADNRITRII